MAREDALGVAVEGPAPQGADDLQRRFEAAAAAGSAVERTYALAGRTLRLRFASARAEHRLARALAHLESGGDAPALTVSVWDSADAPESAPSVPAVDFDESQRGGVVHFDDGALQILYQPALNALSAFDSEASAAWFWAADVATLPEWECATPIRHILHWWLAERGVQQVHGASVGDESGAVLIVGKGGSGKSTIAVNSAARGLLYAGDDYVAATANEPHVYSLYNSAKIDTDHFVGFPEAVRARRIEPSSTEVTPFDREKTIVYLQETHPEVMTDGLPLRAIVIPRVHDGETRLGPASRVKALAALGPSTIIQLHTAGQDALASMRELVERLPAYELAVGPDLAEPVDAISSLLRELAGE